MHLRSLAAESPLEAVCGYYGPLTVNAFTWAALMNFRCPLCESSAGF